MFWLGLPVCLGVLLGRGRSAAPVHGPDGLRWRISHFRRGTLAGGLGFLATSALLSVLPVWLITFGVMVGAPRPEHPTRANVLLMLLVSWPLWVSIGVVALSLATVPWWTTTLRASPHGISMSGRWPRTSLSWRWRDVRQVWSAGHQIAVVGPDRIALLRAARDEPRLVAEITEMLESARRAEHERPHEQDQPVPEALSALVDHRARSAGPLPHHATARERG